MKSIKMTLTALVLATTVVGSALAAGDASGAGVGGADSSSNVDRSKPLSDSAPAASSMTNVYPATPTNKDPAAKVTGSTPNSGETLTDKILLDSRQHDDNTSAK